MSPVGYLFVVGALFALRGVLVGRTTEIPGDAKDLAIAFAHVDMTAVGEILSRRGDDEPGAVDSGEVATDASTAPTPLLAECERLGSAAKGYGWGKTGPDFFDCSGLVWRAMRNVKVFNGVRFTTSTFIPTAKLAGWSQVSNPDIGDIVLWAGRHMGVVSGSDQMYSARSPEKGIGFSSISGDTSYFGRAPSYWRVG